MTEHPIFIHSLFRAGSTYVFHVFRRSAGPYWCYQEPLHEFSLQARDDPQRLLREDVAKMEQLRHPNLGKPYYQELYTVAESCLPMLSKEAVYDAYFGQGSDIGLSFWEALIQAAPYRPVIQECRTSSRIGAIKAALGGYHVYLWRNPWDQWWSSCVDDYFETMHQLFINAPQHPRVIAELRRQINFNPFQHHDLEKQLEHFSRNVLSPDAGYLVFYVLWCLGLQEAMRHADTVLNMDMLSRSEGARKEALNALAGDRITGLDLSDCSLPRSIFTDQDADFFKPLEERAHELLLDSGMSSSDLERIQELRRSCSPGGVPAGCDLVDPGAVLRDLQRVRSLYLQSRSRRCQDQTWARHVLERYHNSEIRAQEAEKRLDWVQGELQSRKEELAGVYASLSWRLTAPLRWGRAKLQDWRQLGPYAGIRSGAKTVLRGGLRGGVRVLDRTSILRSILHRLGLYRPLRALYRKMTVQASHTPEVQELSAAAREVHDQLTKKIERLGGGNR